MRRKYLILIVIVISVLTLSACKKNADPVTLEQYIAASPEMQQSMKEAEENSDVSIAIEGNNVTYTYDFSKVEGYTAEIAKDPNRIKGLQATLTNGKSTYGNTAKYLEDATNIEGVQVIVTYKYGDETLISQTFDSSMADKATAQD